jgi:Nodulation protein S (NodS)
VLEVAGGTGWSTERLAPPADSLTVIDASPEVVAHKPQRVGREDTYVIEYRPDVHLRRLNDGSQHLVGKVTYRPR